MCQLLKKGLLGWQSLWRRAAAYGRLQSGYRRYAVAFALPCSSFTYFRFIYFLICKFSKFHLIRLLIWAPVEWILEICRKSPIAFAHLSLIFHAIYLFVKFASPCRVLIFHLFSVPSTYLKKRVLQIPFGSKTIHMTANYHLFFILVQNIVIPYLIQFTYHTTSNNHSSLF